jgi:ABC-type transport system substrate-binding protein
MLNESGLTRLGSILILSLLVFSGFGTVMSLTTAASAQSSTTTSLASAAVGCPSRPFHETLVSPPNSLNFLTLTTGSSSVPIIFTEYSNGAGFDLPNGSIETISAMTDWIKSSPNYTVWYFNAKPGAKWSNGAPVNASDFLATFGPNFGLNATYDFAGLHTEVKNEYAANSSEAVFVLNAPDSQWWQKLRSDYYTTTYPAAFVNSQGAGGANFGTDIAYGPFYVSNYTSGSFSMKMLRNPYFPIKPKICEVDINFVDSLSETSTYLESGSTDFAFVEYSNAQAVLAANHNLKLYDEKGYGITDVQYNDSIYPYNVTDFRQGLAWSINQSAIVQQAYAGYGLTAYSAEGAVSPIATSLFNSNQMSYGYNPTTALSLFHSGGFTGGGSSSTPLKYPNGTVVTLNLWADTDNTADPVAAQIMATDLGNIGIKVNVQTTTAGTIVGDYGSNVGDITGGMILATINVAYFGNAFLDTLPGWDVYWLPTVPNHVWLSPNSANQLWLGNVSAFDSTSNVQQDNSYLSNIEALNAQYLPSLVLAYPDKLFAVNTQYYTNYPSGNLIYYSYVWNWTALATIQPTAANAIVSGPPTGLNMETLYAIIIAVIVVVVLASAFFILRGRKRGAPPTF